MTTKRQQIVETRLAEAGTATVAEMIGWMGCDKRDGILVLGVMIRCQQLFRVGWTPGVENISIWSLDRPK